MHYHRQLLLDDRVRNGNGYFQELIDTGITVAQPAGCAEGEVSWKRETSQPILFVDRRAGKEKDGQADRPISTGRLNALQRLHRRPINLVVFQGTGRDD